LKIDIDQMSFGEVFFSSSSSFHKNDILYSLSYTMYFCLLIHQTFDFKWFSYDCTCITLEQNRYSRRDSYFNETYFVLSFLWFYHFFLSFFHQVVAITCAYKLLHIHIRLY